MTDLPLARRDLIAQRLAHGHAAVAASLALEFGVSEDAIRRDLRALAAEGRCRRVYGGALPLSPASAPIEARIDQARDRKAALARRAAALVQPGELVFLDNGSTNLALVQFLPQDSGLTVATNSIHIAAEVLKRKDIQLIMIGGAVDPQVGGCVDALAVAAVAALHIDRGFIGACAIAAADGISAFHLADATFKRALCSAGRHNVVLITSDKLETRAPYRVAGIGAIGQLVVEHDAPAPQVAALIHAGAAVLHAAAPL